MQHRYNNTAQHTLGAGKCAGPEGGRGCWVARTRGLQGAHGGVQAVQDGVGSGGAGEGVRRRRTQET